MPDAEDVLTPVRNPDVPLRERQILDRQVPPQDRQAPVAPADSIPVI